MQVTGTVNQVFKPSLIQKHTRLSTFKTTARPVLEYGSKT